MTALVPRIALYLNQEECGLPSWLAFLPSLGLLPRAVRKTEELLRAMAEGNCALVMIPEDLNESSREVASCAAGMANPPLLLRISTGAGGVAPGVDPANFFLNSLVDQLPNVVFVKDARNLRYVRFNRAGEELLGLRADEILGKSDDEIFPAHQARHFANTDRAVLERREMHESFEEPVATPHRGTRLFHTKKLPILAADGSPLFLLGISEDVTEMRRAERQRVDNLREQAEMELREQAARRMAFLAEASTLLASSLDYRRSLQKMIRLAVPTLADWSAAVLRPEQDEEAGAIIAAAHKQTHYEQPLRELLQGYFHDHSDLLGLRAALRAGKSFFLPFVSQDTLRELTVTPERFRALAEFGCRSLLLVPMVARGKIYGSLCFVAASLGRTFKQEDLVMAEELGRRAGIAIDNALLYETARQAVDIRDSFLSIASHELKTPITSLKLHIQMTKRKVCPETGKVPEARKLFDVLQRSEQQVNRLARLVDDLLDVSRIEAGKLTLFPEQVNLSALAREVAERYREAAEGAECALSVESSEDIFVHADPFRLDQVLVNLLSNAFKYGKGHPVRLRVSVQNGEAELEVADEGMGIRPERIGSIFDRFERAELHAGISGLGLGLFIVRSIVEAHGGRVGVRSEIGKGTRFRVTMGLVRSESRAAG